MIGGRQESASFVGTVNDDEVEVTVDATPGAAPLTHEPVDDPDRFREALGRFATGVGVMTTVVDGRHHGMTANAFSSVSLAPPLVLVCVERDTVMAGSVLEGRVFAVSFLAEDQEPLSQRFADPTRARGGAQFDGVAFDVATTGAAVLHGAVGWLDCRLWASYDGGDHLIVVGEVVELGVGGDDGPLLYHRSRYERIRWSADETAPSADGGRADREPPASESTGRRPA